jgi:hypothetical protein
MSSGGPGFVMPLDIASFGAYEPLSAWRAWAMRNNLAHLVDESTQVRINWVAGPVANGDSWFPPHPSDANGLTCYWAATFPHTWLRSDVPVNLDVLITARGKSDDGRPVSVYWRIVPHLESLHDPKAVNLWAGVTTFTSGNGVWSNVVTVADQRIALTGPPNLAMAKEETGAISSGVYEDDGYVHAPLLHLARLEILTMRDAHQDIAVTSVYVREYA